MVWLITFGIAAGWIALAGIAAVIIGKMIKRADEMQERDVW
jgi:hypothetical protein